MKDIDFEELDRAVSSLIGKPGDKTADDAASSSTAQAVPVNTGGQAVPVRTDEKPEEKAEPKPEPAAEKPVKDESGDKSAVVESSPLITSGRSKGVYIDGVRPGAAPNKPNVPLPSKSGKTIQPLGTDVKPDEAKKEDHEKPAHHPDKKQTDNEPKHHEHSKKDDDLPDLSLDKLGLDEKSAKDPDANADDGSAADNTKWPDPIDVYNQKQKDGDKVDKKDDEAPKDKADPAEIVHADDAPDPLSQAPFVAGATDKVEKRPLGAFSDETEQKEEPKESDDDPGAAKPHPSDTQMPADAAKLPPELDNDIVAVELSEAATGANDSKSPEQHEDELDKKNEEHADHTEDQHQEEPAPAAHNEAVAATAVHHQTLSIPQQYREEHESPEHKEHPVFDTKEYHPPITAHPDHGHKYTIWWIALALVVLIVTAVAFGYWVMNGL